MTAFVAFAICMLVGLSVSLVGGAWWSEHKAEFDRYVDDTLNDGYTPIDPQWTITGPGTFRIDE